MELHDLNEFLRLSAVIHYQLTAEDVGRRNILNVILNQSTLSEEHRSILMETILYLQKAYGVRKRRLGPAAVLHPIRATALLSRIQPNAGLLDLLTVLLHDKMEDLTEHSMGAKEFTQLEPHFHEILDRLGPEGNALLMERLNSLTRPEVGETYNHYIGRMLDHTSFSNEVVRAKLADRLDNTLDMRIDIQDPLEGTNFFEIIFENLFSNSFRGYHTTMDHPPMAPLNGVKRLYQLFKNTVLMSLLRQRGAGRGDRVVQALSAALVTATMREAQRIILHIFAYHFHEVAEQRAAIMDAMKYCQEGRIGSVTSHMERHPLDGLFAHTFDLLDTESRDRELTALYANKPRMVKAGLAFIAICMSFLNDPDFYVHGVTSDAIKPETP